MDSTIRGDRAYLATCQTNPLRDSPFIIPRYTRATTTARPRCTYVLALRTREKKKKNHEDTLCRTNTLRYPLPWPRKLYFTFSENDERHVVPPRNTTDAAMRLTHSDFA